MDLCDCYTCGVTQLVLFAEQKIQKKLDEAENKWSVHWRTWTLRHGDSRPMHKNKFQGSSSTLFQTLLFAEVVVSRRFCSVFAFAWFKVTFDSLITCFPVFSHCTHFLLFIFFGFHQFVSFCAGEVVGWSPFVRRSRLLVGSLSAPVRYVNVYSRLLGTFWQFHLPTLFSGGPISSFCTAAARWCGRWRASATVTLGCAQCF